MRQCSICFLCFCAGSRFHLTCGSLNEENRLQLLRVANFCATIEQLAAKNQEMPM